MENIIDIEQQFGAHNYAPLPVVLTKGKGVHLWDDQGKCYLDMMSCYSAVSCGHSHPRLVKALSEQAEQLAVTSRAYYTDKLAPFLKYVCQLTGHDMALPMNTGAEAVETALKAARKWAYDVKKVPDNQAEIIVCENNFHGRTISIVSMSSEASYQKGFGPLTPGFKCIAYNDPAALEKAITPNTAAFLVEPIQGEAGIQVPDTGYLKSCREICEKNNVLLICDEIQTGLGRTGKLFAYQYDDIYPDGLILGKALGGGLLPVSLFLTHRDVMNVFQPGNHGSTFGGNPLSATVALETLKLIQEENLASRAAELGEYFLSKLKCIKSPLIKSVRGKGLLIGMELDQSYCSTRDFCIELLAKGVLSKETHETVARFAPPLTITKEQIDDALKIILEVIDMMDR